MIGVAGGGGGGQGRQCPLPQLAVRLPLPALDATVGAHRREPVPLRGGYKSPALQAVDVHAPQLGHAVGAGPEHVPGEGAFLRAAGTGVGGGEPGQNFLFRHSVITSVVWVKDSYTVRTVNRTVTALPRFSKEKPSTARM